MAACTDQWSGASWFRQSPGVTACTDAAQLDLWFDRAITASTAAEVFAD
jgi:hypothetical protein